LEKDNQMHKEEMDQCCSQLNGKNSKVGCDCGAPSGLIEFNSSQSILFFFAVWAYIYRLDQIQTADDSPICPFGPLGQVTSA